jgi:hypothetical protein
MADQPRHCPTHNSVISSGLNWSALHSVFARDWLEAFRATGRGRVSGDDPEGAPYGERAINGYSSDMIYVCEEGTNLTGFLISVPYVF